MCVYAPFKSATLQIISLFHERDGGISFYKSVIHDKIYIFFFSRLFIHLKSERRVVYICLFPRPANAS